MFKTTAPHQSSKAKQKRNSFFALAEVVVAKSLETHRSIIVFPMMASMMAAVVVSRIIRRTIVNTSVVVIISVLGITIPATVVAGPVKPWNATETDTEALSFGVGGNQSKQPYGRKKQKEILFHLSLSQ